MSERYAKVRTVTRQQIAREMGWSSGAAKRKLWGKHWLTQQFRVGPGLYKADLIDALQMLYRQREPATKQESDWLSQYLRTGDHHDGGTDRRTAEQGEEEPEAGG